MPNINPVWKEKFYIGTSKTAEVWTYAPLCAGIESVTPTVNEQNQQQFSPQILQHQVTDYRKWK